MRNCQKLARTFLTGLIVCVATAADWPTWRGDAARSGYTLQRLPREPSLRWVYKSRHHPRPAWSGRDTRMTCDRAYHPVVVGGKVFFASSADCKVYALDAATGARRWEFFTGGPVRFAPGVCTGRVLVAGDDGFLYCLAADDGRLLWKLRGGPRDDMLLGNDRITSRWPARGGPVIADGLVYFGAGIWPSEGIFVRAVDVADGKVRWCNDASGSIYMPQPHGGANAQSGISAQGYLALCGDRLLVPTGRAVPAALDPAGGKLLYFRLQEHGNGKGGGSDVVATDRLFFNGGCFYDPDKGGILGRGIDTATVAVTPKGIVHARGNAILQSTIAERETVDRKGQKLTQIVPGEPVLLMHAPGRAVRSLIVADGLIVAGGEDRVSLLDPAEKKVLTTVPLDGAAYALAVAEGRLLVGTDKGTIYCFDGGPPGRPNVIEPAAEVVADDNDGVADAAAEQIIRQSGVTEGYCVDLGCGYGELALALAGRTKLQIYAVDPDPKKVAAARLRLDAAGLYGVRVTVHQGDPDATAYPDCFADLVISGRSIREGPQVAAAAEIRRLQRPYGGVACIGKPSNMTNTVRSPLEGAGTWTHQYCDPANTNCSTDAVAKGPLGMLWFTDLDFPMPSRHGRGPAPMFLDGRLFVEGLDALRCVGAYNGRTLWEYPLPGILAAYDQEHLMGTAGTGSNCCVTRDGVYVCTGGKCLRIDPATGKLLGEIPAPKHPDGSPGTWAYVACIDGTLFGTLADTEHLVKYRYGRSEMGTQFTESVLLFALDAKTGELKWSYTPGQSIRNNAIAIAGGKVFLVDRERALKDDSRRDEKDAPHKPGTLVALDAGTGRQLWKQGQDVFGTMLAASQAHGVLLMAYQDTRFKLDSELGGRMAAFATSDGRRLWDLRAGYGCRPIINGRTIYAQPGAWDLLTGQRKDFKLSRSYGCGVPAGSKNLLVYRSATLGYTDLLQDAGNQDSGNHDSGNQDYGGIRPGCWINAIPAGGLLLMPDATDRCTCSYLIKASIALQPMPGR